MDTSTKTIRESHSTELEDSQILHESPSSVNLVRVIVRILFQNKCPEKMLEGVTKSKIDIKTVSNSIKNNIYPFETPKRLLK